MATHLLQLIAGLFLIKWAEGEVVSESGSWGKISSPNWPQPYDSNLAKRWIISAPEGTSVQLIIGSNFSLESAWLTPECYDYINVIDPGSDIASAPSVCSKGQGVKHTFCGDFTPDPVTSCSNNLILDLCSDQTVELKGFTAEWKAIERTSQSTPAPVNPFPESCGKSAVAPDVSFFPNGSIDSIRPLIRIVGGQAASEHSWPWAVNFWQWIPYLSRWNNFCGGSLLNDQWILTAAHCFQGINDLTDYRVKLGAFNKGDSPIANEPTQLTCRLSKAIVHPKYNHELTSHDIALVKLDCQVGFTAAIQPVCIPDTFDIHTREHVLVIGWGTTASNGMQSQTLQEVVVDAVDFSECNLDYNDLLDGGMFCAAAPGKDACQGDSGGPLMTRRNGVWYQDGIVSWGYGCADILHPGIYTRVSNFKSWMYSIITSDAQPLTC